MFEKTELARMLKLQSATTLVRLLISKLREQITDNWSHLKGICPIFK
jgi:hypothetical protein